MTTRARSVAITATLLLALAACGDDGTEDSSSEATHGESHDGGMAMSMNDPDATPADEVEGDVTSGEFSVLDTAPPGSDGVGGTSWLAQNDDGTTVTLRMTGLEPGTEYMAHLHELACDEDNGGAHFAFDPDGEEVPPNEVHLAFTAGEDGSGEATVTNDQRVGDGARSVVIHPAESMDNRLACADY